MALTTLLKDIGSASFLLNTIVVGLDAVEKGHAKPESLDIFWEPTDRVIAARTARKFAVESFIIRAAESLKAYTLAISVFPRFKDIRERWHQDTGIAQKLDDVGANDGQINRGNYAIIAVCTPHSTRSCPAACW